MKQWYYLFYRRKINLNYLAVTINVAQFLIRELFQIMESSGLIKGADTYTTLLIAAARAKDWDRVEELLVETKNNDIKLNSKSYLKERILARLSRDDNFPLFQLIVC